MHIGECVTLQTLSDSRACIFLPKETVSGAGGFAQLGIIPRRDSALAEEGLLEGGLPSSPCKCQMQHPHLRAVFSWKDSLISPCASATVTTSESAGSALCLSSHLQSLDAGELLGVLVSQTSPGNSAVSFPRRHQLGAIHSCSALHSVCTQAILNPGCGLAEND